MLAYAYLQDRHQKIELKIHPNSLQLGSKHFNFLNTHMGGYQQLDDRGYQIPLNYRSGGSIVDAIPSISLQKILTLPDRELKQLIEHKIVLRTIRDRYLLVGLGGAIVVILCGGSVALLTISGYWFPLVPALLSLITTIVYRTHLRSFEEESIGKHQ